MRLTVHKADAINRMGARLRDTLKRCDPEIPDSLRLMVVQIIKDALAKGYTGRAEIHPGIDKMAKWGKCKRRQAQRNARQLEAWGVMTPVSFEKGGRNATRYWVEPAAIIPVMMTLDANPHPDLIAEIRDHQEAIRGDMRGVIGGDMRGVTRRATGRPVSRRDTKLPQRHSGSDVAKPIQGGDDA